MQEIRTIETNRYILKIIEKKYINEIFNILSNPDVIQNLNMSIHLNIDDTNKLINEYYDGLKNNEKFPFEIIDKKTNEFIGVFLIKLDIYDEDSFEFTIYLNPSHWGNGVYTEILPFMTEFAFLDIGTKHFRGFVMEKNIASRIVLEKTDFILEKVFNVDGIEDKIYSYIKTNNYIKKL